MTLSKWHSWWLLLICACGTGGDVGSGDKRLPNPGFAPYTVHRDAMDQSIHILGSGSYGGPFARMESGEVALYVHRCDDERCSVLRSRSGDGLSFDRPSEFLPEAPDVRDPFIYPTVDGDILYGVDHTQSMILKIPLGDSAQPTVIYRAGENETIHEPSAITVSGKTKIFANLRRDEEEVFVRLEGDTLESVTIPICSDSDEPCWARGPIRSAEVRGLRTALGRPMYRILFSVEGVDGQGVWGFAQSNDGQNWSSFPFNPGLDAGVDLGSATQIRVGSRYLLYGEAGRRDVRIIAAINDSGWPSMVWDHAPGPSTDVD